MDKAIRVSAAIKTISMQQEAHSGESKTQSPPSLGLCLPDRIVRQNPQPSLPVSFTLSSLAWIGFEGLRCSCVILRTSSTSWRISKL